MATLPDSALIEDGNGKTSNDLESAKFTKDKETVDVVQPTAKLIRIGLTKEELEKYRNDPFWKAIRYALFVAFWMVWLIMFVGAIFIIVMSPKCAEVKWQNKMTSYKIFTLAFKDSDSNDGFGDFYGIKDKLENLKDMGIDVIWPTPIFNYNKNLLTPESIENLNVSDKLGGQEKFKELIEAAHAKNIKIILDVPLFVKTDKSSEFDWMGIKHALTGNGLLNLTNEKMKDALLNLLKKFKEWEIDGFNLANYGMPINELNYLSFTKEIKEITKGSEIAVYSEFTISTDKTNENPYRIISLIDDKKFFTIDQLLKILHKNIEFIKVKNMELDNDVKTDKIVWRLSSMNLNGQRIDELFEISSLLPTQKRKIVFLLTLVQLFIPGPIIILYGEELGLLSGEPKEHKRASLIMYPWDEKNMTGGQFFLLPKNLTSDVYFQNQIKDSNSPINVFKKVAKIRQHDDFIFGNLQHKNINERLIIYSIERYPKNTGYYGLLINWDSIEYEINVTELHLQMNSPKITLLTSTDKDLMEKKGLDSEEFKLKLLPYSGLVFKVEQ